MVRVSATALLTFRYPSTDGATNTHTAATGGGNTALPPVHAVANRWRHRRRCVAGTQHRSAAAAGVGTKCHSDPLLPARPCRPQQLRTPQFGLLKFVEKLRKLFGLRVLQRSSRHELGCRMQDVVW